MSNFLGWLKWEFSRRIDNSGVGLRLIICERFLKGTLCVIGGALLIFFSARVNIAHLVQQMQFQLDLNTGGSLWRHAYELAIVKFGHYSAGKRFALGAGIILYGVLDLVEGLGLVKKRRWAEYLVLVATGVFLPFEALDLASRFTVPRLATLVVNLAIVAYLILHHKLFLERRPSAPVQTQDDNAEER